MSQADTPPVISRFAGPLQDQDEKGSLVMVAKLRELAVTVVFPGKGNAVVTPRQQTAVFHQHRGMPGPRMGIPGQFRRPFYHLLRHMAVLAVERTPLRLLPWLHACHPFAAKTNPSPKPSDPPCSNALSCPKWRASGRAGSGHRGRDIRSRHRWTFGSGSDLYASHAGPSRRTASGHIDKWHHAV
jgi:hypothetical protein